MSKKIKFPALLMAHDLLDGHVVYWGEKGWSQNYKAAMIANHEHEGEALNEVANEEIAKNKVVDAELVSVKLSDNDIIAEHFRVKIKVSGPTIQYGAA